MAKRAARAAGGEIKARHMITAELPVYGM